MPIFAYQARDSTGQRITGAHEAVDQRTALESLRAGGLFVTKLELAPNGTAATTKTLPVAQSPQPTTTPTAPSKTEAPPRPTQNARQHEASVPVPPLPGSATATTSIPPRYLLRSNNKDLSLFFRQMHAMLHAGTSLAHAINTMATNAPNAGLRTACDEMKTRIASGQQFSELMQSYPGIFTPLMVGMIRAGEVGGFLDRMCLRLSEYAERDYEIQQLIKRETWYPKVLVLAALLIPTIVPAAIAGFTGGNWLLVWLRTMIAPAVLIIAALVFIRFKNFFAPLLKHINPLVHVIDSLKLSLPIVGKTTRSLSTAKFCRALGALQAAGMGVQQTIRLAADASGNSVFQQSSNRIISQLESGASLTDALESTHQFPGVSIQMLRTGEATGHVDEQLNKVADFLENDAETTIKQSVVVLGVLIFLCVAGYIAISVIGQYAGYLGQVDNMMEQ